MACLRGDEVVQVHIYKTGHHPEVRLPRKSSNEGASAEKGIGRGERESESRVKGWGGDRCARHQHGSNNQPKTGAGVCLTLAILLTAARVSPAFCCREL